MRKWNGWGDKNVTYHLPETARQFLDDFIGPLEIYPDSSWEDTLSRVPKTRLPQHPQIVTDADVRVMHALGQSLPDWIAIRYGTVDRFPDGIQYVIVNGKVVVNDGSQNEVYPGKVLRYMPP